MPLYLHTFNTKTSSFEKPQQFTFPFSYEPHQLSIIAAQELQNYLETQTDFQHNFGLDKDKTQAIGKMFGVLVVEQKNGDLGYLAAYSGKLADSNEHAYFVPPIFNMLTKDSFFLIEEEEINALNRQLGQLENNLALKLLKQELISLEKESQLKLKEARLAMKKAKQERQQKREANINTLNTSNYELLLADLIKQSYRDQHEYDVLKTNYKTQLTTIAEKINSIEKQKEEVKLKRKHKSASLQRKLFDQYYFLNARGEKKSVLAVFDDFNQILPPAGAGECAAPKLLQYAYQKDLKPLAIAEFWWGSSPSSEIRKHKHFYPACKNKCEPILGHMLQGLDIEPNPLLQNIAIDTELEIIYQDQDIIVVNKPIELLSVPGINIQDSVYTRVLDLFPNITGPVIVHRLDMSTSGILVLARNKEAHKNIQAQFMQQTVVKRYTALLDGLIASTDGTIELPIRVDLDDRPRQLVCYEHGKPAKTTYKVVDVKDSKTRIHFFPHTGRTHQLRVHAAHKLGLNTAIVGDDLYGKKADRLHLHAGYLEFTHPGTKKQISFVIADPF
ncbi:pseudouridine synthase [Sphingobacterium sp. UT-1RO-CII-1]|uniref:RluA family pseudouridine synthase n=1 Tax=Sphingobacterium sp. UT-1RO-CII-1 TaxID=2995225 RepID=UPI00227CFA35|nr:RluA family pseudouridine synthase [Sphingobacterium sp. UT-1RO-CII-1]MCY4779184.1 pseudouridine synthase [Sphingobacterium sp. UT-1RO-CII-1]